MEIYYILFSLIIIRAILYFFYYCFKLAWPGLYFSTNDITGLFISISPIRYIFFKYLPIFLITIITFSIFSEFISYQSTVIVSIISGAFYGLSSDGKAIYDIFTKSKNIKTFFNKNFQIFLHIGNIILLTFASFIAGILSSSYFIKLITPTLPGLIDNLYSSLITALLAVYLYKIYSQTGKDENEIFYISHKKISKKLIDFIKSECKSNKANEKLVISVCIAENIQRPLWFRNIEYLKGKIFKKGTYGIMQVYSEEPINDFESITLAVKKFFKNSESKKSNDELYNNISRYNNNIQYIDIVLKIYSYIDPNSLDT